MPAPELTLSLSQARRIALRAQLLATAPPPAGPDGTGRASRPTGCDAAREVLRHLGYVQIDTISVVERAHHHVLATRVPGYRPAHLAELLRERRIFEYWSHAASYLPIEDFRFALPRMQAFAEGRRAHWHRRDRADQARVLERIRAEGPRQARDFEAPAGRKAGPWFEWKPAKRALEQLWVEGRLMVRERQGFQKVYDLTERVLPPDVDRTPPTPFEHALHLARSALRAHGLVQEPEIRYLRRGLDRVVRQAVVQLMEAGEALPARVEGLPQRRYLVRPDALGLTTAGGPEPLRILSPFDNLVIQRKRLRELFGFDYFIECYLPEARRKYGYFTLPLLHGERFVGRLNAKADRAAGVLRLESLHWEPGRPAASRPWPELGAALREFARFNGCADVDVSALPPKARAALRPRLRTAE
jgi:uncharacterized protein YcaQ